MDSSKLINSKLEELKTLFDVKSRYCFDANAKIHAIEILPHWTFYTDINYVEWEQNFTMEFIHKFPNDNILFISDDSPVKFEEFLNQNQEIELKNDIKEDRAMANYFHILEQMGDDVEATKVCLKMMTWLIKDIEISQGLDLKEYKDIWEQAWHISLTK